MKLPVAIKTINDRTGRQSFHELTDVRKYYLNEDIFFFLSNTLND